MRHALYLSELALVFYRAWPDALVEQLAVGGLVLGVDIAVCELGWQFEFFGDHRVRIALVFNAD